MILNVSNVNSQICTFLNKKDSQGVLGLMNEWMELIENRNEGVKA